MAGCNTCKNAEGVVPGCQNNGGCQTGGCNKLNSFDWLSNMDLPLMEIYDIVEVRFKGGRKEFFRNSNNVSIHTGDAVVVDVPNGHHIGYVSLQGELVKLQMKKKGVSEDDDSIRDIYRLATPKDMEKYTEIQKKEMPALYRTREIIQQLKLKMKLNDIEFQADNAKATFYYTADDRVDFRELIKKLAGEFYVRVEMRQISLRQEAGRLGGIGVCGRELCCSSWLTDFKSVSTSAARYQNLSLNPTKLSGQCGRLKCCLNYELDTYMDALKDIPDVKEPLRTVKGVAKLQKTDIFRKIMWFAYDKESTWHPIPTNRVAEIMDMNARDSLPDGLLDDALDQLTVEDTNADLERLDSKYRNKKKKKKRKKNRNFQPKNSGQNQQNSQKGRDSK